MKTTFIYALNDPRTGRCRYIGKTDCPTRRFSVHLKCYPNEGSYKRNWIKGLQQAGLEPIFELLDEVLENQWQQAETEYIRLFRALGFALTNGTDGGGGCVATPETRVVMSAASQRRKRTNRSGFRGVTWQTPNNKWRARIIPPGGKVVLLGLFDKPEDAARAYDRAANQYFGANAALNFKE